VGEMEVALVPVLSITHCAVPVQRTARASDGQSLVGP